MRKSRMISCPETINVSTIRLTMDVAFAVGTSFQGCIVKDDQVFIGCESEVQLDTVCSVSKGFAECEKRIFRVNVILAAVRNALCMKGLIKDWEGGWLGAGNAASSMKWNEMEE